jgi:hypothetical protein
MERTGRQSAVIAFVTDVVLLSAQLKIYAAATAFQRRPSIFGKRSIESLVPARMPKRVFECGYERFLTIVLGLATHEFTSLALDEWALVICVTMSFTGLGKPTDNGLCESFNSRLRDECLNIHEIKTIEDASQIIEFWRCDYNELRPNSSLANMTP